MKRLPAPGVLARAMVPPGGYAPFQFGVGGLQPLFAGGQGIFQPLALGNIHNEAQVAGLAVEFDLLERAEDVDRLAAPKMPSSTRRLIEPATGGNQHAGEGGDDVDIAAAWIKGVTVMRVSQKEKLQ